MSPPFADATLLSEPAGDDRATRRREELDDLDFHALLDRWQSATDRLQRTHHSLSRQVHRLTEELEQKNRELARQNRLADLGRMAAHVAHEVRNSLAPVKLYLGVLRRCIAASGAAGSGAVGNRTGDEAPLGGPRALEVLAKIEKGMESVETTVADLLRYTTQPTPRPRPADAARLLQEVVAALAPQLSAQNVRLAWDAPAALPAEFDLEMLRRALLNLLLNALDVMPRGGELCVTACAQDGDLEIEIADSGPGLSPEQRARVFEPFFTTKRGGAGLGLALVRQVAQAHGGAAAARNCPEGGAAFTLRFPLCSRKAAA